MVALFGVGEFFVKLPTFVAHVRTLCAGSGCAYGQIIPAAVAALQEVGLSLGDYVAFQAVVALIWTVLCWTLVVLIVWRKSDDWMALLVASLVVLWPAAMVSGTYSLEAYGTAEARQFPGPLLNLLVRFGFFLVFSLFPNGRIASRWSLVPLGAFFVEEFSFHFLSSWPASALGWPAWLSELLWLATLLSLAPILAYRYRRRSNAVERQQIKWALLGIGAVTLGFVARLVPIVLIPTLNQHGSLYNALSTPLLICLSLVIPLSIGTAILRYRLWDVDLLIRKTLVYALLTATLAAVYVGLIVGLEGLVARLAAPGDQPLVIVVSTLVIAALFQPLRARIQRLIDRRFYRRKYDAAKTLSAFGAALRDEVDLEQLSAHLIAVVDDSMQPAHGSLWLRAADRPASGSRSAP